MLVLRIDIDRAMKASDFIAAREGQIYRSGRYRPIAFTDDGFVSLRKTNTPDRDRSVRVVPECLVVTRKEGKGEWI